MYSGLSYWAISHLFKTRIYKQIETKEEKSTWFLAMPLWLPVSYRIDFETTQACLLNNTDIAKYIG